MPDEQNFTTHLLSVHEAIDRTGWVEGSVIHRAWKLWKNTLAIEAVLIAEEGPQPSERVRKVLEDPRNAEPGVIFENISSVQVVAYFFFLFHF
jgi:hypothetical protein